MCLQNNEQRGPLLGLCHRHNAIICETRKVESNTFENIRQDRGKNSQQVKEARKLHREASVPEGPCGTEELDKFLRISWSTRMQTHRGRCTARWYHLYRREIQRNAKNHSISQVQLCG